MSFPRPDPKMSLVWMEKSQIPKPQVWVGTLVWPLTGLCVSLGLLPESPRAVERNRGGGR